jgi:hypothetical protein
MRFGERRPKREQRGRKRQKRVRSYGPKSPPLLTFLGPARAGETVRIEGNGGGLVPAMARKAPKIALLRMPFYVPPNVPLTARPTMEGAPAALAVELAWAVELGQQSRQPAHAWLSRRLGPILPRRTAERIFRL